MIAIIDYGMGNLRSVQKAFEHVGAQAIVTHDIKAIQNAGKVVLPGVGAMGAAMQRLSELELIDPIKSVAKSGKPFLGICLGLQLLFEQSDEGHAEGLGIFKGNVRRFRKLKVPHMGWNQLTIEGEVCTMYKQIASQSNVYFCHSYFVEPASSEIVATRTNYGIDFVSSVCAGNVWGVQFHPEKSQSVGLKLFQNFAEFKS